MLKQFCGWVSPVDKSRLTSGQTVSLCTATRQWFANHTQVVSFRHCLAATFTIAFPLHFCQNLIRYFNSYALHPQDL